MSIARASRTASLYTCCPQKNWKRGNEEQTLGEEEERTKKGQDAKRKEKVTG